MPKYRDNLPQLGDRLFLTDGGIETTLIFQEGWELPEFAAFHLLKTSNGEAALRKYFRTYAEIATRLGTGLVLKSATWAGPASTGEGKSATAPTNSSTRTGAQSGSSRRFGTSSAPNGLRWWSVDALVQRETAMFRASRCRRVKRSPLCAADRGLRELSGRRGVRGAMNYVEEAIGVVQAARRAGMPVAISFAVETDGFLPTGQTLKSAVEHVDAETSGYTSSFGINCAHPSHFEHALAGHDRWLQRIGALRANASSKSHAELNESTELDSGDPVGLAEDYGRLKKQLARLNVMGGCCGTDHRHIERIGETCSKLFHTATDQIRGAGAPAVAASPMRIQQFEGRNDNA